MTNLPRKSTFSSIVMVILAALLAGGCLGVYQDEQIFNENKEEDGVRQIFQRNRVDLIDKTGDGLRAGNGRITGLKSDKYYLVQIWEDYDNENAKVFREERYVRRNGRLVETTHFTDIISLYTNEGYIGPDTITSIEYDPLDNELTYIVYAAKPLTGSDLELWHHSGCVEVGGCGAPDTKKRDLAIRNSGIFIYENEVNHILNFSNFENDLITDNTVCNLNMSHPKDNEIALAYTGDYLFHDQTPVAAGMPSDPDTFFFLRAVIDDVEPPEPPPPDPELPITVTFSHPQDGKAVHDNIPEITQEDLWTASVLPTLTITNASNFNNIELIYYLENGDKETWTITNGTFDLADVFLDTTYGYEFWHIGDYIFMVFATAGGREYSVSFTVKVTQ